LVEESFVYDSDAYNDDTPCFDDVNGTGHLLLPYAFDINDIQFQQSQRFDTADNFIEYVCDTYNWLWGSGCKEAATAVSRAAPAHHRQT
jgi:hypothetical protein